jgi:hypothetical protein
LTLIVPLLFDALIALVGDPRQAGGVIKDGFDDPPQIVVDPVFL